VHIVETGHGQIREELAFLNLTGDLDEIPDLWEWVQAIAVVDEYPV
jgi:hypothetical protein